MSKLVLAALLIPVLGVFTPAMAHTEDDPFIADLFAGQTQDVGDVLVWNDADYLYVKFVTVAPWYMLETHVHVATSPDGIPQTKKGNPIPGQFQYGSTHSPTLIRLYKIPIEWEADQQICIAAHAAQSIPMETWVFSDGAESFYAKSGPGTTGNPNLTPLPDRSGTAVTPIWEHSGWASVTSQFEYGKWIWESYTCVNPVYGDVVDFEKEFDIPGLPGQGTLWITVDNGFEAFLNGTSLISDGVSGDWRNSDLTESFVSTSGWNSVEVTDFLAQGTNKFRFETANEYFYTDDGHGSPGTITSNPGGLIYEALITYYEDGETAWGDGQDFPGNNWATYFCYTVQGVEIPQEWPEGGTTTVAYEDLPIPSGNDWDYNDWVTKILVKAIYFGTSADRDLVSMEFTVNPQAKLAGYTHVMHLDSDAFDCDGKYELYRAGSLEESGNYAASAGIDVVMVPNTGSPPDEAKLIITFEPGCQFDFSAFDPYSSYHGEGLFFDPYLHVNAGDPGYNIHTGDPRMLTVPVDWAWPDEGQAIWIKYPKVTQADPPNPPTFVDYWWTP